MARERCHQEVSDYTATTRGLVPKSGPPPAKVPNRIMITFIKRTVVLLLVTTLLAIVGVGCNTAHGFGKDIANAGDGIQNGTN